MYEDYSFVFDIDGTICPIKGKDEKYADLIPYTAMVEKIRWYKKQGARIVLFTSRNMNSYKGNLGVINKHTARILLDWLDKWEIPYDEILYGKPWPGHKGFYVDDRAVRPDEFMKYNTEELADICTASQPKNMDVVIIFSLLFGLSSSRILLKCKKLAIIYLIFSIYQGYFRVFRYKIVEIFSYFH